jgi:acyl-CoA synthetase
MVGGDNGPVLCAADPADDDRYCSSGWWGSQTVSTRVAELAGQRGAGVAYHWGAASLTWQQYSALADRVAARLAGEGVQRGDRVLVWLPDGGAVHAAFVGCERAGAVAVAVGWRAGRRELEHLVAKTGATAAITSSLTSLGEGFDVAGHFGLHAVVQIDDLDGRPTVGDGPSALPAGPAIGPSELWLLNSTSGTTGLPKCVMQTINRWVYFHHKAQEFGDLRSDDIFMSVVPAPFGFGLWTAHVTPTLLGVPCVVTPRFDAAEVAADIERHRVTALAAVSSQFVMLLDAAGNHDLSSLRVLFTGGEAISAVRARDFERRTGCRVLNFYGSNETGMLSGTAVGDPLERRVTTGGRVVPEMQVRLYDAAGSRVQGDRGEGRPACKGPATALGYWDDAAANRELFTDDGWMFMGDIVRIDDDGWLTVIARTADFIIRGGKNISAPAVEEEVATHPAVALAAAVPVPDDRLGERVGVFVELRRGMSLDLAELTAYLAELGVSREWWPERLWVLPALPRSSGGKVAKAELRELARTM